MDKRGDINNGQIEDKDYSFGEFNELEKDIAKGSNYKSRTVYGTGLKECTPRCRCYICKLDGKGSYAKKKEEIIPDTERKGVPKGNKPTESADLHPNG